MLAMEHLLESACQNPELVVAVAITSTLGTILLQRLFGKNRRKYGTGAGPTGKGKWKLYHTKTFPSSRCVWLVEEMKASQDFEIIEYNPHEASPEEKENYQSVNPHGSIPVLLTSEGDVVLESAAICLYLAKLYRQLLPDERNEGNYFSWAVTGPATIDPCVHPLYLEIYRKNDSNRDVDVIESNTYKCLAWIGNLEKLLSDKRKYICSNGFTAADIIVGYDVFFANLIKGGMLLRDSPHVQEYLKRLTARPLWAKCVGTAREWMMAFN